MQRHTEITISPSQYRSGVSIYYFEEVSFVQLSCAFADNLGFGNERTVKFALELVQRRTGLIVSCNEKLVTSREIAI